MAVKQIAYPTVSFKEMREQSIKFISQGYIEISHPYQSRAVGSGGVNAKTASVADN